MNTYSHYSFDGVPNIFIWVIPVGSRVTCNPAPTDTDIDYLCFIDHPRDSIDETLLEIGHRGFVQSAGEFYDDAKSIATGGFASFKKGEINLIVTADYEFANKFLLATRVVKSLNVLDKEKRIQLFQTIVYGQG